MIRIGDIIKLKSPTGIQFKGVYIGKSNDPQDEFPEHPWIFFMPIGEIRIKKVSSGSFTFWLGKGLGWANNHDYLEM